MKVRIIDAIDFFDKGGYIDLWTGKYILPECFSQRLGQLISQIPEENKERLNALKRSFGVVVSPEEYAEIKANNERYLSEHPIIRPLFLSCMAAKNLGVSYDQLRALGFAEDAFKNAFYLPEETTAFRENVFADAECNLVEVVAEYMRGINQYPAYVQEILSIRHQVISDWMDKHGLEVH